MRPARILALLGCMLVFSVPAAAEETVDATEAQQEYNNQGVIKMQQGRFVEAVASFRSSLSLGDLNVTYLNLGRAYFRMGHCLDAREAYDAVSGAPKVGAPSPKEVEKLLTKFELEYVEECSAKLVFECEGDPQISVGDTVPRACSAITEWPVKPGMSTVTYRYGGKADTTDVAVEAGASQMVKIERATSPVASKGSTPIVKDSATSDGGSTMTIIGWTATGIGVALLSGALVYDLAVTGPAVTELEGLGDTLSDRQRAEVLREDIDGYQTNTLILAGVGTAATVTGIILLLLPDSDGATEQVTLWTDGMSGGGISARGEW